MELLQLKYFQVVANLQHMTKAAEELHIAQPALSKTIKLLEKNIGVELFNRNGKSIELNESGKLFLKKVNESLRLLEDAQRELLDLNNTDNSTDIKLAILSGSSIIPGLLNSFLTKYPQFKFTLIQHFSKPLSDSDFDLCISSATHSDPNLTYYQLVSEEIFLAVPSNHNLANRTSIELFEVANESFISLSKGQVLREITDIFCNYAGFKPNIVFESDDPSTVRGLIKAGLGIAFVPQISWGRSTGSNISLLSITNPKCSRTITLSWPKDKYLTKSARLFKEFAIEYFNHIE